MQRKCCIYPVNLPFLIIPYFSVDNHLSLCYYIIRAEEIPSIRYDADVAQSVERRLGKAEVTGPIPVISCKQKRYEPKVHTFFICICTTRMRPRRGRFPRWQWAVQRRGFKDEAGARSPPRLWSRGFIGRSPRLVGCPLAYESARVIARSLD